MLADDRGEHRLHLPDRQLRQQHLPWTRRTAPATRARTPRSPSAGRPASRTRATIMTAWKPLVKPITEFSTGTGFGKACGAGKHACRPDGVPSARKIARLEASFSPTSDRIRLGREEYGQFPQRSRLGTLVTNFPECRQPHRRGFPGHRPFRLTAVQTGHAQSRPGRPPMIGDVVEDHQGCLQISRCRRRDPSSRQGPHFRATQVSPGRMKFPVQATRDPHRTQRCTGPGSAAELR